MASSSVEPLVGQTPLSEQREQEAIESQIREDEDRYLASLADAAGLVGTKGIEPEDGFNYCVLLYFLFPEADGQGNVGMWNLLRSFSSRDKAVQYAQQITAQYRVRQVLVTKTCQWNVLSRKSTGPKQLVSLKTGKVISVDTMLEQQQQYRVDQAREQIEQDRTLRQISTVDPDKMTVEERTAYLQHLRIRQQNLIDQAKAIQVELSRFIQG